MNKFTSWWTGSKAFTIYFIGCGAFGAALIAASAREPPGGVAEVIMQGIGIALLSTATVAAPITLYGNSLFISQLRELTIDKLLEMRLAPRLAQELRRETFDADMYDDFRWRISLEPASGHPDLLIMHSRRDYTISNRTYRTRNLSISHSEDSVCIQHEGFTPGYRGVSFTLSSLENPDDRHAGNFEFTSTGSQPKRFMNRPIDILHEKWAVMLNYQLELPPRSCFSASIASEGCVYAVGKETYICDRPSSSLEITVVHYRDTAIGVLELNNSHGETVMPRSSSAADQMGRIEDNWAFQRGFFPGHGIQLQWASEPLLAEQRKSDTSRSGGKAPPNGASPT